MKGWIVVGACIVALAVWRLWPEPDEPERDSSNGAETAAEPAGAAAAGHAEEPGGRVRAAPPPPVRMRASSQAGPNAGLAHSFGGEERNPEWAAPREQEIRRRAAAVIGPDGARADGVECRSHTCRLSVSSDDPAVVARAVEQLGEENGFYRFAEQMFVTAAEPGEGGPRRVDIYLRFGR
jgi:hypothetical protein